MKYTIFIFFTILLLSCGSKGKHAVADSNNQTLSYLDFMIESKINDYSKLDPNGYTELKEYVESLTLDQKTDSIIAKIQSSNINSSEFEDYKKHISSFNNDNYAKNKRIDFTSDLKSIDIEKTKDNIAYRNEVTVKLKTIELMIVDERSKVFKGTYMEVDVLKTVYKSKTDKIKLGDSYEAEIFLIAENTRKPFVYMVDNDTIQIGKSAGTPKFITTPTSKGKKIHKGCIINPQYGFKYEFDIEYTVE